MNVSLALMDSDYENWHWVARNESDIGALDCLYICIYGIIFLMNIISSSLQKSLIEGSHKATLLNVWVVFWSCFRSKSVIRLRRGVRLRCHFIGPRLLLTTNAIY